MGEFCGLEACDMAGFCQSRTPCEYVEDACSACGSSRFKVTPSGRRYCVPCRLGHEKRRKARLRTEAFVEHRAR